MPPVRRGVGGIKLYLARNSFFLVGGGCRPRSATAPAAPRAFIGFIFEPSIGDRDGDGYKDDVDQCPDDPEDFDDFEDEDGCPDPDNDHDGILDVDDKCPNEPETKNGYRGRGRLPRRDRLRSRRRRHPRRRRQVPRRSRGQRRLRGRRRLPRSRQRQGRHPRRRRPVPERARGQGRLRGHGRLPRSRQRQGPHPRRGRQVPERARDLQRLSRTRTAAPTRASVIVRKGKHRDPGARSTSRRTRTIIKPSLVPDPRRGRGDASTATRRSQLDRGPGPRRRARRRRAQHGPHRAARRTRSAAPRASTASSRAAAGHGYGETKPVCTEHNEDCWSKNRRVEFIILEDAAAEGGSEVQGRGSRP